MIRRVILVDDDDAVLASLEAVFSALDYEVQTFGKAADFLTAVPGLAPACIVTDLRMPEMDGLALVSRLKAEMGLSWPVIVISGHADAADIAAVIQAGAIDFLIKPFAPRDLVAVVAAGLDAYTGSAPDA